MLVTLGRFSAAPRKAATAATPTVNLIEGDRPYELVQEQQIGMSPDRTPRERFADERVCGYATGPGPAWWGGPGTAGRLLG